MGAALKKSSPAWNLGLGGETVTSLIHSDRLLPRAGYGDARIARTTRSRHPGQHTSYVGGTADSARQVASSHAMRALPGGNATVCCYGSPRISMDGRVYSLSDGLGKDGESYRILLHLFPGRINLFAEMACLRNKVGVHLVYTSQNGNPLTIRVSEVQDQTSRWISPTERVTIERETTLYSVYGNGSARFLACPSPRFSFPCLGAFCPIR